MKMKRIKVNLLYPINAPGGHGVETAFREMKNGLGERDDVELMINSWQKADIIHAHAPDPITIIKLIFCKGKRVISGHVTYESMKNSIRNWIVPIEFWYYKRFYKMADAMVAVSATTREVLIKEFKLKVPVQIIDNSIDTKVLKTSTKQKEEFRNELGYKDSDFIIVSNGQVQPRKRFDDFIKVAQALPEYKFIWVGGIPFKGIAADQGKMEKLIKNAPKNVFVTDVVLLDLARKYMRMSDVYFHPSIDETFGLAIVEGAAAALPVLLRDIDDYDHTFRPNAIMSAPSDFVKNIKKLANDKKFYTHMQSEAKILASRYDNSIAAGNLVKFYHSILNKK